MHSICKIHIQNYYIESTAYNWAQKQLNYAHVVGASHFCFILHISINFSHITF